MTMFCKKDELKNESDVEQKLIAPLLFTDFPRGFGYSSADVRTKENIRYLLIEKGKTEKRYHPDYVILIAGIPVLVIEAKTPGEDLVEALREARLYAAELNSLFPAGLNPCVRIVATDGLRFLTSSWDSATVDGEITFDDIDVSNINFANFTDKIERKWAQRQSESVLAKLNKPQFYRALNLIGGTSSRDAGVPDNTFGATIAFEHRHLFSPRNAEDRAYIARYAYIQSPRRDRYMGPLNQIIKAAIPPHVAEAKDITDTTNPLIDKLMQAKSLEHQVLLLVGSVGAGKSTFVDRLEGVSLPPTMRASTVWVRMNLNDAPLDSTIYEWVKTQLVKGLRETVPDIDFDAQDTLNKMFAPEIKVFRKGSVSLLLPDSAAYLERLVDEFLRLQRDTLINARCMTRFVCQERGRALIIVLDNCDKTPAEHQLLMFEVAQWVKDQFRCLVFMPIRDVTYDLHQRTPPLDTVLKDMVFRIDPPQFQQVLEKRILLAIERIASKSSKKLTYQLRNGIRVEYPASDQGMYLVSILSSLLEHDKFIRRMFTAIAGKDVRKAMEIFLEFCNSGHISEGEILRIRASKGQYALPFHVVARVLLRMNRRFYDGDNSYVCNIFQCNHRDPRPDHLVRIDILRWLQMSIRKAGPTGVKGYHRFAKLIYELVPYGHEVNRIKTETLYLIKKGCVINEHQRTDQIDEEDLIIISPSGWVHLDLMTNIDYLSACAEDIWFGDRGAAERVADRIGRGGLDLHFKKATIVENASELAEYLAGLDVKLFRAPELFLDNQKNLMNLSLASLKDETQKEMVRIGRGNNWNTVNERYPAGLGVTGTITGTPEFGIFVELEPGIEGLVHASRLQPKGGGPSRPYCINEKIKVKVLRPRQDEYKIDLSLDEDETKE
jgi:hypothetical protein